MKLSFFLVGLIGFAASSCDKTKTKVQYMPDMADNPTVKAQESYIDPPAGSIAMDATFYPKTPEEAERTMTNEVPANDMVIARGKVMYDTYCAVCHGPTAKGGESKLGPSAPVPPDLTHSQWGTKKDGYFFHRITHGKYPLMPGYGHATSRAERWQIVHYLRTLQNKG